jgi:hypothetical protein
MDCMNTLLVSFIPDVDPPLDLWRPDIDSVEVVDNAGLLLMWGNFPVSLPFGVDRLAPEYDLPTEWGNA